MYFGNVRCYGRCVLRCVLLRLVVRIVVDCVSKDQHKLTSFMENYAKLTEPIIALKLLSAYHG